MANVEHPVNYRRAVLREMAAPSSVRATPNITDITQQHAAAQGQIAAVGEASKDKLAEQDRQFSAKLAMDREMLDTWGEQNKWATAIAVANLGVQALGIPAQAKTLERQEGILREIVKERQKPIAATNTAVDEGVAALKKEAGYATARHDSTQDLINARSLVGNQETTEELTNLQNLTTEGTRALQDADKPYFPARAATPDFDLSPIALRRKPGSGLPVNYRH